MRASRTLTLAALLVAALPALADAQPLRRRPRLAMTPQERAQKVLDLLGPEHLVREAWRVTRRHFYDRTVLINRDWNQVLERTLKRAHGVKTVPALHALINDMLGELKTSHLGLMPFGVWFRELAHEFRNRGALMAGCEVAEVGGRFFVDGVAEGGPAAAAGLLDGDELVTIDGRAAKESPLLQEAGHDPGLPGPTGFSLVVEQGRALALEVRRRRGGPLERRTLTPTRFSLIQAARNSVRVEKVGGKSIGVIHLPHFIHAEIYRITRDALRGKLKDADALVLDVRGRGGSAWVVRAMLSLFVGRRAIWHKPVVALTDKATRSAKEIFAWSWRRHGLPIVGENTQGACIGCAFRQLSDGSVLMIPMQDVRRLTRGTVLEGVGVAPSDPVAQAPLPYRAGADTILAAGLKKARSLVEAPTRKKKRVKVF